MPQALYSCTVLYYVKREPDLFVSSAFLTRHYKTITANPARGIDVLLQQLFFISLQTYIRWENLKSELPQPISKQLNYYQSLWQGMIQTSATTLL